MERSALDTSRSSKSVDRSKPFRIVKCPLAPTPLNEDVQLQSPYVAQVIRKTLNPNNKTLELHLQDCESLQAYLDRHERLELSIACQLVNDMIQGLLYLENEKIFFEVNVKQFGVTDDRLIASPTNALLLVTSDEKHLNPIDGLCRASFELSEMLAVLDSILNKSDISKLSSE